MSWIQNRRQSLLHIVVLEWETLPVCSENKIPSRTVPGVIQQHICMYLKKLRDFVSSLCKVNFLILL